MKDLLERALAELRTYATIVSDGSTLHTAQDVYHFSSEDDVRIDALVQDIEYALVWAYSNEKK